MSYLRTAALSVLVIIILLIISRVLYRYHIEGETTNRIEVIGKSISIGESYKDIEEKLKIIKDLGGDVEYGTERKDGVRSIKILSYKGYNHYMRTIDIKNNVVVR